MRALPRRAKDRIILEVKTYRYRGHSMSDPAKYRTREEVSKMRDERDPDRRPVCKLIMENKIADEDAIKAIDKNVKAVVNESANLRAGKSPSRRKPSFGPTFIAEA